jgi:hypothetical protein
MTRQQGFDKSQFAPPPPPPLFGSPPTARMYNVGFDVLSISISFFFNDIFYVIQYFHTPSGRDGQSSSHRNELHDILRDNSCQHPEDRVPPHTCSNSRQAAGHASTRCRISCSLEPHLPAEVGSSAIMCIVALDLASLLRRALMLPRVPQFQTLPPWRDELRCCHVSHGAGLCLPERGAPVQQCVENRGALKRHKYRTR